MSETFVFQNLRNGRKIVNSSISCRRWCKGPPWLLRITENLGSTLKREPERRLPFLRKAAGAKISQCSQNEEVKGHINTHFMCDWNEMTVKRLLSSHWRESLVPAAAVIPAPVAYTKVAAIKTAVVVISDRFFYFRKWRRYCKKPWTNRDAQNECCRWSTGDFVNFNFLLLTMYEERMVGTVLIRQRWNSKTG